MQYAMLFLPRKRCGGSWKQRFCLHEAEELSHTASHVTIFTDGKKPEFSKENAIDVNTMKIQAIEEMSVFRDFA